MDSNDLTLESLIKQGNAILDSIRREEKNNGIFPFTSYSLSDEAFYERWKNVVIRFLSVHYRNDISVKDFRAAMTEFENKRKYPPTSMQKMIGVLESINIIPNIIEDDDKVATPAVIINKKNEQKQSQEQPLTILVKSIEDTFTISQLRELKQIINEEKGNIENAKPKLIDKIKSFGGNVASNVIANLLTNPSIWNLISNI